MRVTARNTDKLDEVLGAFLAFLEGVAPRPSLDHLDPAERAEAEKLIRLLEITRGVALADPPAWEDDPVAVRFGYVDKLSNRSHSEGPADTGVADGLREDGAQRARLSPLHGLGARPTDSVTAEGAARQVAPRDASFSPPGTGTTESTNRVIPMHSFSRRLPAAAGGNQRPIGGTYTSLGGRLTTEVVETPEARLVVRISTADAPDTPDGVVLVRLQWALVAPTLGTRTETLVVPLAPSGDGDEMVAKYDLGSLDQVEAVRIGPGEWSAPSELTADLVRRAFGFSLYGTARRAWEHLAATGVCPPAAQSALLEMLDPERD